MLRLLAGGIQIAQERVRRAAEVAPVRFSAAKGGFLVW